MSRCHATTRRRVRAAVESIVLAGLLTLSGCATVRLLPYQVSVANQMTLARLPAGARYRVTTGADPSSAQTSVRTIRFAAPGSGSWSSYLNEALRTELSTAGNYDSSATEAIEATLLDVHVSDGKAELVAHFVVRRDQTIRYDKVLRVSKQWDSQFLAVLAASDGLNQTSAIFQDLLRKLFEDPDFVAAA